MKNRSKNLLNIISGGLIWAAAIVLTGGDHIALAQTGSQQMFNDPEQAVNALKTATKAKDKTALASIFGPRIKELLSGDAVSDASEFEEFADELSESTKLEKVNDQKVLLLIGDEEWEFAAPIIKESSQWRFDTSSGIEELINRRIGANEMDAILTCKAYALAQFEYFDGDDWDGDQVSEYAQKISSSPGKKDGLFWRTASDDEVESPLGSLFADAALDGYKAGQNTTQSAAPLYGYNFKILFRQGASAPGGKFDYVINGNMIAGFALVAYPARWGSSGVMTFLINQEGRVYEKDLGPRTETIAAAMTEYNPDVSWNLTDIY